MKKSTKIKIAVGVGVTLLAGGLAYGYFRRNGWRDSLLDKKQGKLKSKALTEIEGISTKSDIIEIKSKNVSEITDTKDLNNVSKLYGEIRHNEERLIGVIRDLAKDEGYNYYSPVKKSFDEFSRLKTLENKVESKMKELETIVRKENKD